MFSQCLVEQSFKIHLTLLKYTKCYCNCLKGTTKANDDLHVHTVGNQAPAYQGSRNKIFKTQAPIGILTNPSRRLIWKQIYQDLLHSCGIRDKQISMIK